MTNWKSLAKSIPSRLHVGKKTYYTIVWVDNFPNENVVGETRHDIKQIAIKIGQSPKQTVLTYLHEIFHVFSDEYEIKLTETQIQALESYLPLILKPDNVFIKGKK